MNSRGFTVVELIAAFSITMVISVLLFELLIDIKDVYIETVLKTNIAEKTSIISKNIYNLFEEYNTVSCDSNVCLVNGKNISFFHDDNTKEKDYVIINNQKFSLPNDGDNYIKISNMELSNYEQFDGGYIKLKFDLISNNLSKPYSYNVVYYYRK